MLRITTMLLLGSSSSFFLSFEMNISRLRPTITPSSSQISFCSRLLAIISLGNDAKMSSSRISVPVKSMVLLFISSCRFCASNSTEPKVKILLDSSLGKSIRVLTDLKKTKPTMAKNDRPTTK